MQGASPSPSLSPKCLFLSCCPLFVVRLKATWASSNNSFNPTPRNVFLLHNRLRRPFILSCLLLHTPENPILQTYKVLPHKPSSRIFSNKPSLCSLLSSFHKWTQRLSIVSFWHFLFLDQNPKIWLGRRYWPSVPPLPTAILVLAAIAPPIMIDQETKKLLNFY